VPKIDSQKIRPQQNFPIGPKPGPKPYSEPGPEPGPYSRTHTPWPPFYFDPSIMIADNNHRSRASKFYTKEMIQSLQANVAKYDWAKLVKSKIVSDAQRWVSMSDNDLRALMFGSTIKRSWMVWSNGICPSCGKDVPMYNWKIDALNKPWQVQCPWEECNEFFPKNDFYAFYVSGLDANGIFDPNLANRQLLFNSEPNTKWPKDFGVDDGTGYKKDGHIWWFIGAYLIYGQWKQMVLGGISKLSSAYVVTRDPIYAYKAGVLLDRVADLYPTFDFKTQGRVYENEKTGQDGYVSIWHDACEETRELVLAYDRIADTLPLAKQKNIEDRILIDVINNRYKIESNVPRTDTLIATIYTVLSASAVSVYIDKLIDEATSVDGVSGEKGLAGYCQGETEGLAIFLELYARADPNFLGQMLKQHPKLQKTYRFHIDTLCLGRYYPQSGDTGAFAYPTDPFKGVSPPYIGVRFMGREWDFSSFPGIAPSMYTFLWRLFQLTGDKALIQALYRAKDNSVGDLPYDLFADDPEAIQKQVSAIIASEGSVTKLGSVNKQEWHLAILRSGEGPYERALWLDYDSGGGHGPLTA
jgi:oligo-alginate lyase